MKKYDVTIIGAGPAGMMGAITAAANGERVALVEKNPQIGRKLLATGNGRCNLTNMHISVDRYGGADSAFIEGILRRFDQHATMDFFEDLGLILKEEDNGRIFPRTNQASSVVEVLRQELSRIGVDLFLGSPVERIEKSDVWRVSVAGDRTILSDKLILATGGRAAHQFGSTGDGFVWAKRLGHTLRWLHAALVPIESVEQWPKDAQGIKIEAGVRATSGDNIIGESFGDVLFTNYGLSGTAVMALSGRIAPALDTSSVLIHIDLFPDMAEEQLRQIISRVSKKPLNEAFVGLLPSGLIPIILDIAKTDQPSIVRTLKDLTLTVSKLRPFKEAQVTAGGVNSDEINPQTLQSKIVPGLYFAGEILDADGDSGGFNLQWAWSSGRVAGS